MTHRKVTKMTFFITSCYISELQYNVLMRFFELLEAHQMSAYKLAKMTGIPYTTIFDLVHYRTLPKNISLDHALKIADALDIDVKELVKIEGAPMTNFEFFRSQLIMNIKSYGPNKFVNRVVKNKEVDFYYKNGGIEHALFLLGVIDYLSRKYHLSINRKRYNDLRKLHLKKPLFCSNDIISFSSLEEAESVLGIKIEEEFRRFNIVETEISALF